MADMKDMSGVLFRNDKKETETHPDHTGRMLINGELYYLSAWINEAKSGQKYFAIKAKLAEQKPKSEAPRQRRAESDEIPF